MNKCLCCEIDVEQTELYYIYHSGSNLDDCRFVGFYYRNR